MKKAGKRIHSVWSDDIRGPTREMRMQIQGMTHGATGANTSDAGTLPRAECSCEQIRKRENRLTRFSVRAVCESE